MPPAAPPPHPKGRSTLLVLAAAAFAVVSIFAGAGIGHLIWPTPASSTSGSGGYSLPFGSGSSGGISPFGSGSSGSSPTGAGAPSDISTIASEVDPGLVDINTNLGYENEQAAGTGMVLTSSGVVLTNNHVIDGATTVSATDIGNGKTYTADVVGYDRTSDVAVLKLVGASGLRTITASSQTAAVGEAVVALGNAQGAGGTPSEAGGSVTATDQSITASDSDGGNAETLQGLIEVNAGIVPGDSGGALADASGKVIGMNTAASEDNGFEVTGTQGYAIPIATAESIAQQIRSGHGSSTVHIGATAFLGVEIEPSNTGGTGGFGIGGSGGTSVSGAEVEGTLPGSPAAQAGLGEGDVITSLGGQPVSTSSDLTELLVPYHPGDSVQLQWTDTSGQTHSSTVKLASGPPS